MNAGRIFVAQRKYGLCILIFCITARMFAVDGGRWVGLWSPISLQLDCSFNIRKRKINFLTNRKSYDKSKTVYGKLSERRIQIYWVYFCVIHF